MPATKPRSVQTQNGRTIAMYVTISAGELVDLVDAR